MAERQRIRVRSGRAHWIVLALLAVMGWSSSGNASDWREWRFDVYLNDRPIGHHHFQRIDRGGQTVLKSEASFDIKALFIPVYSYRHQATEIWENGCLKGLTTRTNDNGDRFQVHGVRERKRFRVSTLQDNVSLPPCVMSFAYWNPAFLSQARLLNAQTGDYIPVKVSARGVETLELHTRSVQAKRYHLSAEDIKIDLWYSQDNQWLMLESRLDDQRALRYVLNSGGVVNSM